MAVDSHALSSRYEFKYRVAEGLLSEIRAFLKPFVQPDSYARLHPDNRYCISTLYLDSPALDLYRSTANGERHRFKLRIRSYSELPSDPVYLEVKERIDQVIRKERCKVPRSTAVEFLRNGCSVGSRGDATTYASFSLLARQIGARPILWVRYQREAYQAAAPEPLRITFDTVLQHRIPPPFHPILESGRDGWQATPCQGAIVEIKFTGRFPSFALDLVRQMNLIRTSVPKYLMCVESSSLLQTRRHAVVHHRALEERRS